jgi:hypothetical protein
MRSIFPLSRQYRMTSKNAWLTGTSPGYFATADARICRQALSHNGWTKSRTAETG